MVKRIVVVLVLAVIVFGLVLAFNTLTSTSSQVEVTPAPRLEVDADAVAKRLSKSVTYRTISHQERADFEPEPFRAFQRFLQNTYPLVHKNLEREMVNGHGLLYTWKGSDTSLKPILLLAHYDVVPVAPGTEDLWIKDAFSEIIEEGFIWGRGTLDDKVNVLAIMEAIELFLAENKQPTRTVILAFGHDEEVGGAEGAVKISELLKSRNIEVEFALDEGGALVTGVMPGIDSPVATIGIAEKGYVSITLLVNAIGGHSSQPPQETAVGIMAQAIHRLEKNQMPAGIVGPSRIMLETIGPEMSFVNRMAIANLWLFKPVLIKMFESSPAMNAMIRTTTAPTIIHAGVKDNVLPAEVKATINFRVLPGETAEDIMQHMKTVIADERVVLAFTKDKRNPSKVSPPDAPPFELLERTIREIYPDAIVTPYLVIGGTDARHYEPVSENIYRFSPIALTAEDLPRMHGINERVGVENYTDVIRFYHRLIENTAL